MMDITDFNQYQEGALRSLSPARLLANPVLEHALHCVLGMAGEAGEFAETPYSESEKRIGELGDCLWYSAVLANVLDCRLEDLIGHAEGFPCEFPTMLPEMQAMVHAARAVDLVKKSVYYSKPLEVVALHRHLIQFLSVLLLLAAKTNINLLFAADVNLKKLRQRYPDKFCAALAINRDYKAESVAAGCEVG